MTMTAHVQELLKHRRWIEELARRLVADPHQAEDLAQEALTAALRARPNPPPRSMRSWLARVMRNALTEGLRRDGGRSAREAFVARSDDRCSSEASTLELVERMSVHRSVVETVLELPEPYREVLLRRYFEDESPTVIAERLGVPVSTVKTRLQRALARMREELDRAYGGDGRGWLAALAPLTVSPRVGSFSPPGVVAIATLVAIVVTTGVFWIRPDRTRRTAEIAARPTAPARPNAARPEDRSPAPSPSGARSIEPSEAPSNATMVRDLDAIVGQRATALSGRVLHWDGTAVPGALVRFEPVRDPRTGRAGAGEQIARSDPDGRFRFAKPGGRGRVLVASPGLVTVYAGVRGAFAETKGQSGGAADEDAALVLVARRSTCTGRVQDASGSAIPDARLELRLPRDRKRDLERELEARGVRVAQSDPVYVRTRSDAAGSFTMDEVPDLPGLLLTVRAEGFRPWSAEVPASPSVLTLEPLLPVPADGEVADVPNVLVGSVRTADGAPAVGARVSDGRQVVRTDREGRFAFPLDPPDALAPQSSSGRSDEAATQMRLHAILQGTQPAVWTGDPRRASPELRLGPAPLQLSGEVVDPQGRALRDVRVWLDDTVLLPPPSRPGASRSGQARPGSPTDAAWPGDGSTADDDEGLLEIRSGRRGQAYSFEPPETVEGYLAGNDAPAPRAKTDAAGRFDLAGLADRPYRLVAVDPRTLRAASVAARPGEHVRLVLDPATPSAWPNGLACRVLDVGGQPLPGIRVTIQREDFRIRRRGRTTYSTLVAGLKTVSDENGAFRLDDLPPPLHLGHPVGHEVPDGTDGQAGPDERNALPIWVRLEGPGILPCKRRLAELSTEDSPIEVTVERRVAFRVRLAAGQGEDAFEVHDVSGTPLPLLHARGSERETVRRARLESGESGRWSTSERATTLVLLFNGRVARREPITLRASFDNLLDF